jgi:hypothetical protein
VRSHTPLPPPSRSPPLPCRATHRGHLAGAHERTSRHQRPGTCLAWLQLTPLPIVSLSLEAEVDDKVQRREEWLALWHEELTANGWARSPSEGHRRALYAHDGRDASAREEPALPGVEVHLTAPGWLPLFASESALRFNHRNPLLCPVVLQLANGRLVRARHTAGVWRTAKAEALRQQTQRASDQKRLAAVDPAAARVAYPPRHPQHATVGRRANVGLSVPYRAADHLQRGSYSRALQDVAKCERMNRRELAARQTQLPLAAMSLHDVKQMTSG